MQTGAFALIDALGFKRIWRHHDPQAVLKTLDDMSRAVDAVVASYGPKVGFRAAFLSDAIALGVTADQYTGGGPLLILAHMIRAITASAATSGVPLAYRGCVAYGDFDMTDRFLIGPAVDEAAEGHEVSEAAVVWFAPTAQRFLVGIAKGADVDGLPTFDVPMKGGTSYTTTTVSPFAPGQPEVEASAVAAAILGTFDRPGAATPLGVAVKKQNTGRFLAACMKARGFNWSPPT